MRTVNYTDVTRNVAALIGVASSDLADAELSIINTFFGKAFRQIYQQTNWLEACQVSEYRVPGNTVPYPNSARAWTLNSVTATNNVYANPIDGRFSASEVVDTTSAAEHYVSIGTTERLSPTEYSASVFINRGTHRYFKLAVVDAASVVTEAVFDAQGLTVTASGVASIQDSGNGWVQLFMNATPTVSGTASFRVYTSLNGTTFSYTGAGKYYGLYGASLSPIGAVNGAKLSVPFEYPGLDAIDAVFEVYRGYPWSRLNPRPVPYQLTGDGIQIIAQAQEYYPTHTPTVNITSINRNQYPVYIHYRKAVPKFRGNDYSASVAYSIGDCVYYEANEVGNYYECVVASTGNTPTDTIYWKVSEIPEGFLDYCVYSIYADWLVAEGQTGKAAAMMGVATELMTGELDKLERQNRHKMPIRFQTHLNSRAT